VYCEQWDICPKRDQKRLYLRLEAYCQDLARSEFGAANPGCNNLAGKVNDLSDSVDVDIDDVVVGIENADLYARAVSDSDRAELCAPDCQQLFDLSHTCLVCNVVVAAGNEWQV
jgi:hypothetical protein